MVEISESNNNNNDGSKLSKASCVVFYFSNTGNTEYIVKRLINNTLIKRNYKVQFANVTKYKFPEEIKTKLIEGDGNADMYGLCFPIHMYRYPAVFPNIVANIFAKFNINKKAPWFYITTAGGADGTKGRNMCTDLLWYKLGQKPTIITYAHVIMPENWGLVFWGNTIRCTYNDTIDKAKDELDKDIKAYEDNNTISEKIIKEYKKTKCIKDYPNPEKEFIDYKFYRNIAAVPDHTSNDVLSDCIGCGACVRSCPENYLVIDPKTKKISVNTDRKCNKCLTCYSVCPVRAIRVKRMGDSSAQYVFKEEYIKTRTAMKNGNYIKIKLPVKPRAIKVEEKE